MAGSTEPTGTAPVIGQPLWLLAELTYQCPLHCVFCYNPTQHARINDEMSTAQWVDVMQQARKLGAAQLGFSGGEPLLRDDLEELVQEAHRLGYYTNLITSGVGLTATTFAALVVLAFMGLLTLRCLINLVVPSVRGTTSLKSSSSSFFSYSQHFPTRFIFFAPDSTFWFCFLSKHTL